MGMGHTYEAFYIQAILLTVYMAANHVDGLVTRTNGVSGRGRNENEKYLPGQSSGLITWRKYGPGTPEESSAETSERRTPSPRSASITPMDYDGGRERKDFPGRYYVDGYPDEIGDSYGHYYGDPFAGHGDNNAWFNYEVKEVIPGDKRPQRPNQMVVPFPPCFYGPRLEGQKQSSNPSYFGAVGSPRGGSQQAYSYFQVSQDYRNPHGFGPQTRSALARRHQMDADANSAYYEFEADRFQKERDGRF